MLFIILQISKAPAKISSYSTREKLLFSFKCSQSKGIFFLLIFLFIYCVLNEIVENKTGETYIVDPSVSDYLWIHRITKESKTNKKPVDNKR